MQETKAYFIIKKNRSILRTAIIVEAVSFIDTLVNLVVVERFMGLMTLFIGLSMALVISAVIVLARYGRDRFPFLIEEDPGQETFIYDFNVDAGSAVSMGATVR